MTIQRNCKKRRGAAVVETAMVLGIFMLFLIGILEYARYLFFMHMATNATAAAARYAVVHTADGTTMTQVQQTATDAMAGQNNAVTSYAVNVFPAQVGVSPPTPISGSQWTDAAFGAGICVQITGTYNFAASSLFGFTTGIPITVSAVMTSEAN